MLVTVHGPNLTDSSKGSYRVHAEDSPENGWEVRLNGSLHPETLDVSSREDVINHVYPFEEYDREPGDPIYVADVHFSDSCTDLPDTNEGEDMKKEYTAEEKAEALAAYKDSKESFRGAAKKLSWVKSPTTVQKIVEQAQAEAETAAAAERAASPRAPRGGNVNTVDPEKTRRCSYEHHIGDRDLLATEDNFATRKSGARKGTFVGWCRDCNRIYGERTRAAKKEAAKTAEAPVAQPEPETVNETAPDQETPSDQPNLTAVA